LQSGAAARGASASTAVESVRQAVALAEAALAKAEAAYVDGRSSQEAAAMVAAEVVAAEEALGGVEIAMAAAVQASTQGSMLEVEGSSAIAAH